MTRNSLPSQPPAIARWLLDLFVPGDQAPPMLGDLLEEFGEMASRRGAGPARRWYWHQSAKTIPHLLIAQFRSAPWRILAAVLTGLFLLWLLANFHFWTMVWGYYPANWPEPLRLLWLASYQIVLPLLFAGLVGLIVAQMGKGREMPVTITLSLVMAIVRVASYFHHWHFSGRPPAWSLLFLGAPDPPLGLLTLPVAILVGGLIARTTATRLARRTVA